MCELQLQMRIVMPKRLHLSHTAMEVEMVKRNQDAKVRTSEVGQINRFPHCINRFFGILIASLCVGFHY